MLNWIKNNSIATVWMVAATLVGLALPNFVGTPSTLDHIGGAGMGLFVSAYMSLYVYNGPMGPDAWKRIVPGLCLAGAIAWAWYLGVEIPGWVLPGAYAGSVTLFVAAVFARIKNGR